MKQLHGFFENFVHHWDGWSRSGETKHVAKSYMMGIILPSRKKNMSGISRKVGLNVNAIQQFITDSPWDYQEAMKTNIRVMAAKVASDKGVIVVDDTGQEKKGDSSPGVKRQYSGTIGKVGNCQIGVGCCYCVPGRIRNADAAYWPTGMRLYLPKDWFENKQRLKNVGIPKDIKFQTKPEIALDLIKLVLEEGVPHRAITADTAYGTNKKFRNALRSWKEPYVVAVTPSDISIVPEDTPVIPAGTKSARGPPQKYPRFPIDVKPKTADVVAEEMPNGEWQEVEWSEGTKGRLSAHFIRIRVRVAERGRPTDETGWMLFERRKDGELRTYICWGLGDTSLEDLVSIAHTRWPIEQCFKQMKREIGLDELEGRKWRGWHHHAAMVMMSFSYLMLLRVEGHSNEKLPTLPQVRREMLRIYVRRVLERRLKITPEEADAVLKDIPFLIPD